MQRQSVSLADRSHNDSNATRREIWALEKELSERNADDQDATTLKELIDKSTLITQHVARPSDQANSCAMFKKLTAASNSKVVKFCRKTTTQGDLERCNWPSFQPHSPPMCACDCSPAPLHGRVFPDADLARKLTLKFSKADGGFDWEGFGAFGAEVYSDNTAARVDFMMGAIEPPSVELKKPREKKRVSRGPKGPELRPEVMDTEKQDDSNETSKLTEAMYSVIGQTGRQPWVFYVLNHQSFAQTVENMFSVSMLLGNAKVALVPDDEWGMCVQLPERSCGQRSVKPEQSQMVLNLNNVVWQKMRRAVRPDQCLTAHRADICRVQDVRNEAGPSKRARLE